MGSAASLHRGDAEAAIDRENHRAAQSAALIASDPRWVLAARVHARLDGAALDPDRRQQLIDYARSIGIRPFDAQIIIALVQDRARRGEQLHSAAPSLSLIDIAAPDTARPPAALLTPALLVLGASVLLALFIARWILGA